MPEHSAIVEARRWVAECGEEYRAETMQALLDGNDVATHWASKVLAAQDMIEALVEEVDRLGARLKRHRQFKTELQSRLMDIAAMARDVLTEVQ